MPTRNISLTEHLDRFVEDSIASGRYLNASEVVREGLRLLEHRHQEEALKLQRLREAAQAGVEALERGEFSEFSEDELDDAIATIGKAAAKRARRSAG